MNLASMGGLECDLVASSPRALGGAMAIEAPAGIPGGAVQAGSAEGGGGLGTVSDQLGPRGCAGGG